MAQFEKVITKLRWKIQIDKNKVNKETCETFYDYENNNFDTTRVKATDLPFNKRVYIPPCADEHIESKISFARIKVKETIDKFSKMKTYTNLTEKQKDGLRNLDKRKKEGEIVIFPTDKSGTFTVNTPENYIDGIKPHLNDTEEVTMDTYRKTEELLNAHMIAWCKITNMRERMRRNFIAKNNAIPPEYGLPKDHKTFEDQVKGPPVRPVCGAVVSANYRISYFMSMLLKPFVKLAEEACDSTEDLLYRIEKCNQEEDITNSIIGSFDVDALYPSLDIKFSIEKCVELISEFEFEFRHFDIEETGLYLAMNIKRDVLQNEGLMDYCPTRYPGMPGRKPKTTSAGKKENKDHRWKNWIPAKIKPDNIISKKMIIKAIGFTLELIFNNHIFTFNKKTYRQTKGGAIGVGITGEVANLFMIWWDRQLKYRLQEENISLKLYTRYVDDGTIVVKAENKNGYQCQKEIEKETMEIIKNIANGINPNIQVKVDFPLNNNDSRLPALDLKLWIEEVEINGQMKPQIIHSHYMKPMANRHVIHKESAMSIKKKINILSNDLVRIIKNTSMKCKREERNKSVQYYMKRLQYSGYNKEDRFKIYIKAKKIYENTLRSSENGERPMYRGKFWNMNQRIKDKEMKKHQWYSKAGYLTTMFVDATINNELATEIEKHLKECDIKIKVLEKSGETIRQKLVKSDPFSKNSCEDENCNICSSNPKINCKTREINYSVKCENFKECNGKYSGETSRSIKERGDEHLEEYRQKKENSVFYQHMIEKHNGEMKLLKFDIDAKCRGDALLRQVTEAVLIRELKPELNAKMELNSQNSSRIRKRNIVN